MARWAKCRRRFKSLARDYESPRRRGAFHPHLQQTHAQLRPMLRRPGPGRIVPTPWPLCWEKNRNLQQLEKSRLPSHPSASPVSRSTRMLPPTPRKRLLSFFRVSVSLGIGCLIATNTKRSRLLPAATHCTGTAHTTKSASDRTNHAHPLSARNATARPTRPVSA